MYITQNSAPRCTVWYPSSDAFLCGDAAFSFRETILKIADAEVPVRTFDTAGHITDADGNTSIVLAPLDLCPWVKALFCDELDRIADTDGFAYGVRFGRIYITAASSYGIYYGVHRFLEDNADVLWVRGEKDTGTLFNRHGTIEITSDTLLSIPAFKYRGWNLCGQGSRNEHHADDDTMEMLGRNGVNMDYCTYRRMWRHYAIRPFGTSEYGRPELNIDEEYIESRPDFFMTNPDGSPKKGRCESFINYFNLECAEAVAKRICGFFDEHPDAEIIDFSMPDNTYFIMCHKGVNLQEQPYTLPDGRVIEPTAYNFKSTVYWCFMNHLAKIVKAKHPGKLISSLAYIYSEHCPEVDLEDNLIPIFAPITGDDHAEICDPCGGNVQVKRDLEGWSKRTRNLSVYNYWGCFKGDIYSRPIAKKVQNDLKWYRELGVAGLTPEGTVDSSIAGTYPNRKWTMNSLYLWQCAKLFWDPDIDLDALTKRYCRLAYGKSAPFMEEYYRLIQQGWDAKPGVIWYTTGGEQYIKQMILGAGLDAAVLGTLKQALDAVGKEDHLTRARIKPIYDTMCEQIELYRKFKDEDAYAMYTDKGEDILTSDAALLIDDGLMENNPWNTATPLTVFMDHRDMTEAPAESKMQARLMWDKQNLYVLYKVYDPDLNTEKDPTLPEMNPLMLSSDSFFKDSNTFAENYIVANMTNMSTYYSYYSDLGGNHFRYISDGSIHRDKIQPDWKVRTVVHSDDDPAKRYYVHVQVIPFASLGLDYKTAMPGGMLVHNSKRYGIRSWTAGGLWTSSNFKIFKLVGMEE